MSEQYKKDETAYPLNQTLYNRTIDNDINVLRPFSNQSELEITVRESNVGSNKPQIDKSGAICAFFLCDLPFDC